MRLSNRLPFPVLDRSCPPYNPRDAETPLVWADPRSLAATWGITVVLFSSRYLDVSVHGVRPPCGVIGFPHSDIRGSQAVCAYPRLFAAYHVLHRLCMPRHPPCALPCFLFGHPLEVPAVDPVRTLAPSSQFPLFPFAVRQITSQRGLHIGRRGAPGGGLPRPSQEDRKLHI